MIAFNFRHKKVDVISATGEKKQKKKKQKTDSWAKLCMAPYYMTFKKKRKAKRECVIPGLILPGWN